MSDPVPTRATKASAPVTTQAAPLEAKPLDLPEKSKHSEETLDRLWADYRARQGMLGCGQPLERPKGWKP